MSLQIGKTALNNSQIALDTVGKNIAHANDPNYTRQRVQITNTHAGNIITRIEHAVNESLEKDLVREQSLLGFYTKQQEILTKIENNINELSENDLSTVLDEFYEAMEELSLNPHDVPLRQSVIEASQKVSDVFRLVDNGLKNIEDQVDREIGDYADEVNHILERIAELNLEVARREGGVNDNPAVDLRDSRRALVNELSSILNVTTTELSNGSVLVQTDGRTLVFQGEYRGMYIDRSDGYTKLRYNSDNSYVEPSAGQLGGLIKGRDELLGDKQEELDSLARNFAWQINKVHNAGRGLKGLTEVTANTKISINYIDDALDIAEVDQYSIGQDFRPSNGVMTFEVQNETTGSVEQVDIGVTLIGEDKMSLEDFRDAVSQIDHLTSSIDTYGRLSIQSDEGYSFFISEDTSDLAAFLGLNNFFTGNAAGNIDVNETLVNDVELLAAGKTDAAGDNDNLSEMINTRSADLGTGFTFFQTYQTFVSDVASEVSRISALQTNQDRIVSDVSERRNSFSGVNLDEEAANLLRFQQSYQAAAEYISVQNRLLDLLFQAV